MVIECWSERVRCLNVLQTNVVVGEKKKKWSTPHIGFEGDNVDQKPRQDKFCLLLIYKKMAI